MKTSETFTLDSIEIAITRQIELLRKVSEKDNITYDKVLDKLNSLMIIKDKLKR